MSTNINNTPLAPLKGGIVFMLMLMCVVSAQELSKLAHELPQSRREFEQARAPRVWRFPRDHGQHEAFQTEWWYYTGNLRSADGRRFGYQLTFFRNALATETPARQSRWAFREGYVAHFTITAVDQQKFFYDQRMTRGALQLAGAANDSLAVNVGAWSASGGNDAMRLQAQSAWGSIALELRAAHAPVLHGAQGLVRKGSNPGEASYYYSQPFLQTSGRMRVGEDTMAVAGVSWMDHEFFTSPQQSDVAGWDWFSLHLSDSSAIMLYVLRQADGSVSKFSGGTLMSPGKSATLPFGAFEARPREWWRSPATGGKYPLVWELQVGEYDLRVTAPVREQELDTRLTTGVIYWEGYIAVSGKKKTQPITGLGYLEMTGYAQRVALNARR
ncbi:MAG: lipocalin-like domain-containing protein [candidate division KSB1 bacterium]